MAGEEQKIGQIIGKAWADDAFKRRLLAEPAEVMREYGIDVPPEIRVVIHENTIETRHVVLPRRPDDFESGSRVRPAIIGPTVPFYLFLPRPGGGRKRGGTKRTR